MPAEKNPVFLPRALNRSGKGLTERQNYDGAVIF
jgi:hypothetical protein